MLNHAPIKPPKTSEEVAIKPQINEFSILNLADESTVEIVTETRDKRVKISI
jgi:hypothetical protein